VAFYAILHSMRWLNVYVWATGYEVGKFS
jgi:hypothetical protein